jgi:hypothetical protein
MGGRKTSAPPAGRASRRERNRTQSSFLDIISNPPLVSSGKDILQKACNNEKEKIKFNLHFSV